MQSEGRARLRIESQELSNTSGLMRVHSGGGGGSVSRDWAQSTRCMTNNVGSARTEVQADCSFASPQRTCRDSGQ